LALALLLLLLGGTPGAPSQAARRTESLSAVDVSAAQRFGWVYKVLRREVVAASPLLHVPSFTRTLHAAPWLLAPGAYDGHEIARAARWIDALPVKVDALDGGFVFALRMRGP
jgi:hypothetical protein